MQVFQGVLNMKRACLFAGHAKITAAEIMPVTAWNTVPVQVITTSIWRMTSLSLTTRKPSMLHENTHTGLPFVCAAVKAKKKKRLKPNGKLFGSER